MTGEQLKNMLEDVCDNLFNPNPYYQQGGDMVRVGGVSYECAPKELIGKRIQNMVMSRTGEPRARNILLAVGHRSIPKRRASDLRCARRLHYP